jgi:uncharacterized membrane protein
LLASGILKVRIKVNDVKSDSTVNSDMNGKLGVPEIAGNLNFTKSDATSPHTITAKFNYNSGSGITPREWGKMTRGKIEAMHLEGQLQYYTYLAYGLEWDDAIFMPYWFLPARSFFGFLIALVKRRKAKDTIYESHFSWIIHTYCILAVILGPVGVLVIVQAMDTNLTTFHPTFAEIVNKLEWPSIFVICVVTWCWKYIRIRKGITLLRDNLPIDASI